MQRMPWGAAGSSILVATRWGLACHRRGGVSHKVLPFRRADQDRHTTVNGFTDHRRETVGGTGRVVSNGSADAWARCAPSHARRASAELEKSTSGSGRRARLRRAAGASCLHKCRPHSCAAAVRIMRLFSTVHFVIIVEPALHVSDRNFPNSARPTLVRRISHPARMCVLFGGRIREAVAETGACAVIRDCEYDGNLCED